ncbi:histidine kinase [Kovacikia minuta CCNUW1]|uniref:PAS domain-containing sensor histidine kinase n=1 Tax=Kovacikia minuta TaxID=2931930 RepID=UPI001CCA5F9B|nr:histidine kinase [Kovacikia minuta CCNUW1]
MSQSSYRSWLAIPFIYPPFDSITTGTPASFVRNAQLLLVASAICYLTGQLRSATQRLTQTNHILENEIQERIKVEAALNASQTELRALFAAIPDPLFVIDAEGRILRATLIASEKVYRPIDEQVTRTLHEIFEPSQADTFLGYIQQALQTQQSVTAEYSLLLGEQETWFAAHISPTSENAVIWLARDISDRKRAEAASILEERNRMAREIHDTLAQAFTGILVQVGGATQVLADDREATQAHLEMIDELARTGLVEARRSVAALRPQLLEEGNLESALHHLVTQMRSTTDTALIYETQGTAYVLPTEVENNLLRMGQEALTNAIKYAHAHEIRVELVYRDSQCILRVKDDGQGFGVGSVPLGGGYGLLGMSERAERIGAHLAIQSQPGQGTEITVVVDGGMGNRERGERQ